MISYLDLWFLLANNKMKGTFNWQFTYKAVESNNNNLVHPVHYTHSLKIWCVLSLFQFCHVVQHGRPVHPIDVFSVPRRQNYHSCKVYMAENLCGLRCLIHGFKNWLSPSGHLSLLRRVTSNQFLWEKAKNAVFLQISCHEKIWELPGFTIHWFSEDQNHTL